VAFRHSEVKGGTGEAGAVSTTPSPGDADEAGRLSGQGANGSFASECRPNTPRTSPGA